MDSALFDLVGAAQASQGGVYIRDGKGRLIVDKLDLDKKTGGNFFVGEFKVESSQKIVVVSAVTGQQLDIAPNEPGTSCSMVIPIDNKQIPSGPANVKTFVLALLGYSEAEVNAQPGAFKKALSQLCDRNPDTGDRLAKPNYPARGMVIDFETYRKQKKTKREEELVIPRWTHVPRTAGNDPESIAKRRAALDSNAK